MASALPPSRGSSRLHSGAGGPGFRTGVEWDQTPPVLASARRGADRPAHPFTRPPWGRIVIARTVPEVCLPFTVLTVGPERGGDFADRHLAAAFPGRRVRVPETSSWSLFGP